MPFRTNFRKEHQAWTEEKLKLLEEKQSRDVSHPIRASYIDAGKLATRMSALCGETLHVLSDAHKVHFDLRYFKRRERQVESCFSKVWDFMQLGT